MKGKLPLPPATTIVRQIHQSINHKPIQSRGIIMGNDGVNAVKARNPNFGKFLPQCSGLICIAAQSTLAPNPQQAAYWDTVIIEWRIDRWRRMLLYLQYLQFLLLAQVGRESDRLIHYMDLLTKGLQKRGRHQMGAPFFQVI